MKSYNVFNMHKRVNNEGFISIFSVLIIMGVLTLVAIGFSNVTRRAARRALDYQLSTQAFYAAESGVNDAKRIIAASPAGYTKLGCKGGVGYNYNLDPALGIGYTCVLVNTQLDDLKFDSVPLEGAASPKVVAFESSTNVPIKSFEVIWDTSGTNTGSPIPGTSGYPNVLDTSVAWANKLGVLRIDLAPTNGSLDRANIINNSYTFFLYPSTDASATTTHTVYTSASGEQGLVAHVKCAAAASPCRAIINLNPGSSSKYVMRLQSVYNTVKAKIINVHDGAGLTGSTLTLQNGQTIVDSTGKAADVLRRIQVRLPVALTGQLPSFAIQSADSICKRLYVGPVTKSDPAIADPACALEVGGGAPPPVVVACDHRFPGDPNPIKCGKSYWGASIDGNGDPAKHETPTGTSLSIRRTYWQWDDIVKLNSKMYKTVADDLNSNRLPFISIKPPDEAAGVSAWKKIADGVYDKDLDAALKKLDSLGGPVWIVFNHEPEGGGPGGNVPDDIGGAPQWIRMQQHVRDRMNAPTVKTQNLAFIAVVMAYTWDKKSGRNPLDWWKSGVWDAYFVDTYNDNESGDMFSDGIFNKFVAWVETAARNNIPYGVAEWGNAGTTAATAQEMQEFWDWGFANKKDMIGYSYYDSALNGGTTLSGLPLAKFQNILKKDTRVQRIKAL